MTATSITTTRRTFVLALAPSVGVVLSLGLSACAKGDCFKYERRAGQRRD